MLTRADKPASLIKQRERGCADWYRRFSCCSDAYGGLLPAPTRFPRINVRSRNRSAPYVPPPCEQGTPSITTVGPVFIPRPRRPPPAAAPPPPTERGPTSAGAREVLSPSAEHVLHMTP